MKEDKTIKQIVNEDELKKIIGGRISRPAFWGSKDFGQQLASLLSHFRRHR